MDQVSFFKNFLGDRNVASVMPSSLFAVRRVCNKIDFDKKVTVVEYGAGSGVFSRFILEKMNPQSKLILIETNKNFVSSLREINDPRVLVFNDSAENVGKILDECNLKDVDYVVSGIPFSFLDKDLKARIIRGTHDSLSTGGKFLVYQFSNHVRKHLKQSFNKTNTSFELFNIPPLFIFESIK